MDYSSAGAKRLQVPAGYTETTPDGMQDAKLMAVIKGLVLIYSLYAGMLFALQRDMLFPAHTIDVPAQPTLPDAQSEILQLPIEDYSVEAWWLAPLDGSDGPAPVLIVAHGNGDLIDFLPGFFQAPRLAGWGVLLVEFPGYGRSQGRPSEASIEEVMKQGYDWLASHPAVDRDRIVVWGQSLGGGAAALLSRKRQIAGLVLQSTFTSVRAFASRYFVPGFLIRDPFDNLDAVRRYRGLVRVLHGRHDPMIPVAHGEALAAAAGVELQVQDCRHNDCLGDPDAYWEVLLSDLEQELRLGEQEP